jgi:hypothetical protein
MSSPPHLTIDDLATILQQFQSNLSSLTTEVHGLHAQFSPSINPNQKFTNFPTPP